ncbi:samB, partial [[Candida] subhashii]
MRDSNYKSVNNNKAAVTITTSLYDRRALDVTSDKPLVNSLNYLTYFVSSSAKVRETLSVDGGIERLVEILHECHNTDFNIQDQKCNSEKKLLTAWKWTLAFQCLVLAGTRGTEKIRQKVVKAGILPIIATVLDNYLSLNERTFLHANARQGLNPTQQQSYAPNIQPQSEVIPNVFRAFHESQPEDIEQPSQMQNHPEPIPRQNIRGQFAAFNNQFGTDGNDTPLPTEAAFSQAFMNHFNFNFNSDNYQNSISAAAAAIEATSISNTTINSTTTTTNTINSNRPFFHNSHVDNLTSDDYENLSVEQLFKLIRITASAPPPFKNENQHQPPSPQQTKHNTISNDIRRRYIIVNILHKLKQEKQMEMLDDRFFNDCDYNMDSNLQFLADMYARDFEINNRQISTNNNNNNKITVRNFTETGVVIPRDDDVVWSLQLLAYISKYPYLKDVLQNTHIVTDMSIREKHMKLYLERQMKLKMKKTLAIKLKCNSSPKSTKTKTTYLEPFDPSPSNSPQMLSQLQDDNLILDEDKFELCSKAGLTENAELEDEEDSEDAEGEDEEEEGDTLSNGSGSVDDEMMMNNLAKHGSNTTRTANKASNTTPDDYL